MIVKVDLLVKPLKQRPDASADFLHLLSPGAVLSSGEAGSIPLTQKLKLTVSEKGWGCHRQRLALNV